MFRTALLILSGNATASLLLLVRNLIVARLIPVEDYGIAATFAVVMAMVEMASTLGLQQQIVQSKDGDDPRFQAALQGFQVLRGGAAGIVLFLIAGPIARFLGIPEVIWAYQVLALVPVIKAFEHFDIHRFNRQMRFWPLILTGVIPALLSLVMVWPLAIWLGDWRVLLYAILAQTAIRTLTSHCAADQPYLVIFDLAIMRGALRFGWPLLANAAMLFLVFQGDKLIVGRVLGMEALAVFAMGVTLTLTPTVVFANSTKNFFLPQLSKLDRINPKNEARFQSLGMMTSEAHMLFGASFVVFIAIFGHLIVTALLGTSFTKLIEIFSLLAVLQCLRVLKEGPISVALADGRTENAVISNIIRVSLLPFAYFVAVHTARIDYIILVAVGGEALGFFVALFLLGWRSKVNVQPLFMPTSAVFLICALTISIRSFDAILAILFLLILLLVISLRFVKTVRNYKRLSYGIKL